MQNLADVLEQEEIENHGVWVPFGEGETSHIQVAAAGNPAMNRKRIELEKRYRRKNNLAANKEIPEEDSENLYRRAAFGTLFKGWRGPLFEFDAAEFAAQQAAAKAKYDSDIEPPPVTPEGGHGPLPFCEPNALWYMEHSKRFRRTVFANAGSDDTFNRQNLELLGKA